MADMSAERGFDIRDPFYYRADQVAAIKSLVSEANSLIQGSPAGEVLGRLVVARPRYLDAVFNGGNIRSYSLPDFGEGQFWFALGSSDANLPSESLLGGIVEAAEQFLQNQAAVTAIAQEAQALVASTLPVPDRSDWPIQCRGIGVTVTDRCPDGCVDLALAYLGDNLTFGVQPLSASTSNFAELEAELNSVVASHQERRALLERFHKTGTRGLMSDTAQRVFNVSGMSIDYALGRLEHREALEFSFQSGALSAQLFWKEGQLLAFVNDPAARAFVTDKYFRFILEVPEAVRLGLVGKPLSVVTDRPHFPVNAIIKDTRQGSGFVDLELDIPNRPFSIFAGGHK